VLPLRRALRHRAVFAAFAAVAAVLTGLGTGVAGLLASTGGEGFRGALSAAGGSEVALRVALDRVENASSQDETVRAAIARAFDGDGSTVPLDITRREVAPYLAAVSGGDLPEGARVAVMSIDDLAGSAALVDGGWADGPGDVTLQADAAAALGLTIGDRVRVNDLELRLTGTWRALDGLDPRWFGDPLLAGGSTAEGFPGPLVIDDSIWADVCISSPTDDACLEPDVEWILVPGAGGLRSSDISAVAAGWELVPGTVQDAVGVRPRVDGGLVPTMAQIAGRVDLVRGVAPVALLVIAVVGFVVITELARLLAAVRDGETRLLRSRGGTARRLGATTLVEVLASAALGSVAGLASGALALVLTTGAGDAVAALPLGAAIGALVTVVAAAVAGGTAEAAARRALRQVSAESGGRGRAVLNGGVVVLVTLAAGIAVWQLVLYGSPVTPAAGGGTRVDPLAVVATPLALTALVLLAVAGLTPLATLLSRRAGGGRRLGPSLVARNLARRTREWATPVVLVGLACGQVVLAASYGGTWATAYAQSRELELGAPVVVSAGPDALTLDRIEQIASSTRGPAAPVQSADADYGSASVRVIAATSRTLSTIASDAARIFDPDAAAAAIATASLPVVDGSTVRITADLGGFTEQPILRATVMNPAGSLATVELVAADGSSEFRGGLPPGDAWTLLAIDVVLADEPLTADDGSTTSDASAVSVDLASLEGAWQVVTPGADGFAGSLAARDHGFGARYAPDGAGGLVRLVRAPDDRLPTVISEPFAETYGLEPGTGFTVTDPAGGGAVALDVALVVTAIPGAGGGAAVLVDLGAMRVLQLATEAEVATPELLWTAPGEPRDAAIELRRELPPGFAIRSVALDPVADVLGAASTVLWLGAAGAVLLALIAVVAIAAHRLRDRAPDVVVLRALGLGSRDQAGIRRAEFAVALTAGVVVGTVTGAVVSAIVVPVLARAAVPGVTPGIPTLLRTDALVLGVASLVVLSALAAIVAIYGRRVARQARDLGTREQLS
jgi:hypothetical protein